MVVLCNIADNNPNFLLFLAWSRILQGCVVGAMYNEIRDDQFHHNKSIIFAAVSSLALQGRVQEAFQQRNKSGWEWIVSRKARSIMESRDASLSW